MNKVRVLLVDDETGFTTIVKINLEKTGDYEVAVENDSLNAVSTAKKFQPDIVFLDMVMPGMDGGDVRRLMQESPELCDIPVIFLTALVSHSDVNPEAGLTVVGDDIMLPKPIKMETLMSCINQVLTKQ